MNQLNNFSIARKELKKNQQEIANELDITRETISNTERNKSINYAYLHFLVDAGFNKDWLMGDSECEKYSQKNNLISQDDNTLIVELKQKAEKAELKAQKSESRILQLERKIMEVQSEMNVIYKFLFKHSDKLDLSELELSLGKRKVSSTELTILSKAFGSQAAHV